MLIRTQTLTQAFDVYRAIFSLTLLRELQHLFAGRPDTFTYVGLQGNVINVLLIACVIVGDILARTKLHLARLPTPVQGTVYAVSVLTILYQVIATGAPKVFVYFQF